MLKIKQKYLTICIFLSLLVVFMSGIIAKKSVLGYNNTTSEIVMDVLSGRVLYENNAREKKYMASTTKILTAITIIDNFDLEEIVTVGKETIGIEGSSIYLQEGEKLSIKNLLYGLMLRSGNDCAETLAIHCSGSIDKFADLMNKKAKEIGAINSSFVNPHGLHNENHYTTAYDLALISSYAIKNSKFKEIVSTKSITIPFTTQNTTRRLINKNKMLKRLDGCTGIKTGYTKKAGRCLVTSCQRNGMELVSVVLNCGPMWERSASILNNAFSNYSSKTILKSNEIIDFFKPNNSNEEVGVYVENDVIIPLQENELDSLKVVFEYKKNISTPIKKGQNVGEVKIYNQNNLLFTEKIYTIIDVD